MQCLELGLVVAECFPVCYHFSKQTKVSCRLSRNKVPGKWKDILNNLGNIFFLLLSQIPYLILFECQWLEMDQVKWKNTFGEMRQLTGLCNKVSNQNKYLSGSVIYNSIIVWNRYIMYWQKKLVFWGEKACRNSRAHQNFLLHKAEMNVLKLALFLTLLIFASNSFCFSCFPFLCLKKDMEGEHKRLGKARGRKYLEKYLTLIIMFDWEKYFLETAGS